ncbi:oligosaccharide repeat unit polymerase, partial [Vibrio vulnificus]|nr:oligosaccharide repeat unit polymerase [Vibrio vulnificus]
LVFLSFISLCFVYYVNNFSVISMFVRAGEFKDTASNSSSVLLIMTYLGKFIPFFCLMAAISVNNKNRLLVCYLFLVLLVCVFPFGNARFLVASVYIPLLIICYPKILKGVKGISLFIFSLLVLFPFFDNFRNLNDNEEINFIPSFDFFLNGHFDSYQSFLRVLENDVVTYGRQLLGVIFFFIPRAVWSDKPSGSGYYISELFNYGFSNISMNYFGEGYINFGLVGVFVFVAVLIYFISVLDSNFILQFKVNGFNYNSSLYLMLLGYIFFLLRGDLLSSFSFLVSALVAFILIKFIMKLSR